MAASPVALATPKVPEGIDLYSRFALAGALGCSVTHGAFTPVDVSVVSICLSSHQRPQDYITDFLKASRQESSSTQPRTTAA